jgi:MraZ protein
MPLFLGTHTPKIDDKGRFFLPAKFRDGLGAGLVMIEAPDRCLAVYPLAEFMEKKDSIVQASASVSQKIKYQRKVGPKAYDGSPDKQGRVMIPPELRAFASLDRDLVVIGAIDRVEIWNPQAWQEYSAEQEASSAELGEVLFPL